MARRFYSIFNTSSSALKRVKIEGEFPLELGKSLKDVEMVYEEWGNKRSKNVVVLFPR